MIHGGSPELSTEAAEAATEAIAKRRQEAINEAIREAVEDGYDGIDIIRVSAQEQRGSRIGIYEEPTTEVGDEEIIKWNGEPPVHASETRVDRYEWYDNDLLIQAVLNNRDG